MVRQHFQSQVKREGTPKMARDDADDVALQLGWPTFIGFESGFRGGNWQWMRCASFWLDA